ETNKLIHSSSSITQNEELYLGSSTFESCDDLLKSVRAFYYTKGYGLSIRDSKKDKYVALQCKKGTDGTWVFKIHNLEHNHEPSTDMFGHPSFRRLPEEDVHTAKPRKDDRSLVGALLEELEKGRFSHDVDHDSEGRITRLFIIHPLSLKLARIFSNVFVMDFTYKTNKYKMPLFDIIGVSCFNTSFYSGFVFLKKEDKDSYVWDLKVFKKFLGHASQPAVIISDRELALLNVVNEFNEIKVKLASERIKIPHDCNMPLFRELLSHVSLFALKEIYKQRIDTLSLDLEDDAHNEIDEQFAKLLNELQSKYQAWPLMIQRPRGRPPKAKKKRGVTSTTRDPSRFEYVESSQAQNPSSSSNGFPKTIHQENSILRFELETCQRDSLSLPDHITGLDDGVAASS
ncbi:PKS-NRPS hybrid synthetase, partial [Tanacetum coccineum]